MFRWLSRPLLRVYNWFRLKILNLGSWFRSLFSDAPINNPSSEIETEFCFSNKMIEGGEFHEELLDVSKKTDFPEVEIEVDFSNELIDDEEVRTESFANMYKMSSKRKWQWLRNLVALQESPRLKPNEYNEAEILAQFANNEELLASTDLSFARNPVPLVPGDAYVNQEAFEEYLSHLAHYRHYHLFAHVLMGILKKNSVSTVDLLKNLLHARDQLQEHHFFDEKFSLFYVKNKSQQWIASLIHRISPKLPTEIMAINVFSTSFVGDKKNILLCDDICYTGTQVIEMLSSFCVHNKNFRLTLLFGKMSIYALTRVQEKIKALETSNPEVKVNIVVGEFFHTLSSQLDFLQFPPTRNERHIIKQLLESQYNERYTPGDFRRRPLLTTAWKKPDFVSSYYKFLGFEKNGPDPIIVSSALLSKPPNHPIKLFSHKNPAPNVKVSSAFISGPQPPYR